jgi:hypothetical protein
LPGEIGATIESSGEAGVRGRDQLAADTGSLPPTDFR